MRVHPLETDLAFSSDGEMGKDVAGHLRWCARCRSAVTDYAWLEGEIESALAAAADAVDAPRPKWWAVQASLRASRRRQTMRVRFSSLASVVMAACLMLFAPGFLSPAGAMWMNQPGLTVLPEPAIVSSDERVLPAATPTPAVCREEATPLPTPAFVPPPAPPRVES